jgi:catechol 2,3-dioxygenase-like lactoylglutathione lyase family enzyme
VISLDIELNRVDHFSYALGDINRSVEFYTRLGFQPINRYSEAGPHVDPSAAANADRDIQLLRHGDVGPLLELIGYSQHPGNYAARNCEVGSAHMGFVVEEMASAYATLKAQGVEFLSEPNIHQYGEHWLCLRDPDGIPVELMQLASDSERALSGAQEEVR